VLVCAALCRTQSGSRADLVGKFAMAIEPAQSVSPPYQGASSQPLIGRGWVRGVALVMGILAYRTRAASMPLAMAGQGLAQA
jgi:hypothetical protein